MWYRDDYTNGLRLYDDYDTETTTLFGEPWCGVDVP